MNLINYHLPSVYDVDASWQIIPIAFYALSAHGIDALRGRVLLGCHLSDCGAYGFDDDLRGDYLTHWITDGMLLGIPDGTLGPCDDTTYQF